MSSNNIPDPATAALGECQAALRGLNPVQVRRVMAWLNDEFKVTPPKEAEPGAALESFARLHQPQPQRPAQPHPYTFSDVLRASRPNS